MQQTRHREVVEPLASLRRQARHVVDEPTVDALQAWCLEHAVASALPLGVWCDVALSLVEFLHKGSSERQRHGLARLTIVDDEVTP